MTSRDQANFNRKTVRIWNQTLVIGLIDTSTNTRPVRDLSADDKTKILGVLAGGRNSLKVA